MPILALADDRVYDGFGGFVYIVGSVAPDYIADIVTVHKAIAQYPVARYNGQSILVYPPFDKLGNPTVRVGVTGAYHLVPDSFRISIGGLEILELRVCDVGDLVDAYNRILTALKPVAEVVVASVVETKSQRSAALEIPRHQILGLLILAEVAEYSIGFIDYVCEIITLLSQDKRVEMRIVYMVQHFHEQEHSLAAASVSTCDNNIGIGCQGILLAAFLCDDMASAPLFAKGDNILIRHDSAAIEKCHYINNLSHKTKPASHPKAKNRLNRSSIA